MSNENPFIFLRRALFLDAGASGLSGILFLLGAGILAEPLGLSVGLMRIIGLSFVPFVLLVGWAGMQERPGAGVVWTIIVLNALWVAASLLLVVGNWLELTFLGNSFVIIQGVAVGLFAELQFIGLRKTAAPPSGLPA